MFVLTTIADTVRIPPSMFYQPTLTSAHTQIETKYPNRVLMDVGLIISRYGDVLKIGDGVCVPGDGAAHHEVVFRMIVYRPFVEEVCIGTICESGEDGVRVSLGEWFHDIFIPAYWMLNPSHYEKETGLWVWAPKYDDDDDDGGDDGGEEGAGEEQEQEQEEQRFEMEIGAQIRFKVKAINFTQVTNTAKGVQATTSSTTSRLTPGSSVRGSSSGSTKDNGGSGATGTGADNDDNRPVRKRSSSSVDLTDSNTLPASMQITASICEDGLGLVSWWTSNQEEEEVEEEQEEEQGEGGGEPEEAKEQDENDVAMKEES